jgi:hypothetical protein
MKEESQMHRGDRENSGDSTQNLMLTLETASDMVSEIRGQSRDLNHLLKKQASLDAIVTLLGEKKAKVDTLKELAREIGIQLRVDANGFVGISVPESCKVRFVQLMADFRELLEEESRLEDLICGQGFPISRRVR